MFLYYNRVMACVKYKNIAIVYSQLVFNDVLEYRHDNVFYNVLHILILAMRISYRDNGRRPCREARLHKYGKTTTVVVTMDYHSTI